MGLNSTNINFYKAYGLVIAAQNLKLPLEPLSPEVKSLENSVDLWVKTGKLPSKKNKTLFNALYFDDEIISEIYLRPNNFKEGYDYQGSKLAHYMGENEIIIEKGTKLENNLGDINNFLHAALSGVLHARNSFLLHASAIEINGQGLVFIGDSGGGKSSVAFELLQKGHKLIADDICLLRPLEGGYGIVPAAPFLKLSDDVSSRCRQPVLHSIFPQRFALNAEKKHLCRVAPHFMCKEVTPLNHLFHLKPNNAIEWPTAETLYGESKLNLFVNNPARPFGLELYKSHASFRKHCFDLFSHPTISCTRINRPAAKSITEFALSIVNS